VLAVPVELSLCPISPFENPATFLGAVVWGILRHCLFYLFSHLGGSPTLPRKIILIGANEQFDPEEDLGYTMECG
jgi:hypothetical protein